MVFGPLNFWDPSYAARFWDSRGRSGSTAWSSTTCCWSLTAGAVHRPHHGVGIWDAGVGKALTMADLDRDGALTW